MRQRITLTVLFVLLSFSTIFSQSDTDPLLVISTQNSTLYDGPGDTFLQAGWVREGTELRIIERNRIGNWLRVQREPDLDGWIIRGHVAMNRNLRYSTVPVNETIADGDPDTIFNESQKILIGLPVIPQISPLVQLIFEEGLAKGNLSNVVTKVGDSVIANPAYLQPFSQTDFALGAYDYLSETVFFYNQSMAVPSVAAQVGMSSFSVFDPVFSNVNPNCQPNETPLTCEYRIKKPAIAFIGFGANDVLVLSNDEFKTQITQIVQESLAAGVIPVLSTFSVNPASETFNKSIEFNLRLVEIAQLYNIPIMNMWLAARPLPDFGLDIDNIHYFSMGYRNIIFDSGFESWRGVTLQNLIAIRTLNEIFNTLDFTVAQSPS
jgi:hypothetical protein